MSTPAKTVLFVTYGGGHARMVIPVIRALHARGIQTVSLALTSAAGIFKSEGLDCIGYKDLVTPDDGEALRWGRTLAAEHHNPESGIAEEESIAYLGLSYYDTVLEFGEEEAAARLQHMGRRAFKPVSIMERAITTYRPDMVVTTNSPRSETAMVEAAKLHNIPSMSMVDLVGTYSGNPMEADYITVLAHDFIHVMQEHYGVRPHQKFLVTGNPAFDPIFDARGPIDSVWRARYLPTLPPDGKMLLWIDTPVHYNVQTREPIARDADAIRQDLDQLAAASQACGACLLIRPHPSQSAQIFHDWMAATNHPHVAYAGGLPLHPLLRASDAIANYYSTVACEAALMQRPVLQLNYYDGNKLLPLGDWGIAEMIATADELNAAVARVLYDPETINRLLARSAAFFVQEKAAPKIAGHIQNILFH